MINRLFLVRSSVACLIVSLVCLSGCSGPDGDGGNGGPGAGSVGTDSGGSDSVEPAARTSTAKAEDVEAAKKLLDGLAGNAKYTLVPDGVMTEVVIEDGSALTAEDVALFGRLTDLETLQIQNCRILNDEMVAQLADLKNLTTLALTNSVIGDPAVETIVKSFPNLTNLDLSYNANMTNGILKVICELGELERLTLIQNRFNDLGTGHLAKLKKLRVLDLRGNMEAGDMSMEIVGALPNLVAFKHRSTTVGDFGLEYLAESKTLRTLLIQDFGITSMAGEQLAKLENLTELEIFRCQGFGSDGVLALKGMKLSRLTLRDLPMVDDMAMEVLTDLPELKKLYIHENDSISDYGLANLESLESLEVLDIWAVPQMTDATVDVIAELPNLKELSIRTTGVTDAAIDKLLAMPELQSLTLKDNGMVTPEGLEKLSGKEWTKLDVGQ
jgi:Leucine-rich repeat (LRR) protein